jgi:dipeptidyl aminopeptidase
VDTFSFPIYNPTFDNYEVVPYTEDVKMKYPKPGYNNPIVSLKVFDVSVYSEALGLPSSISAATLELDWEGRQAETDSIIQEVKWVGNDTLMIKEVNRNSDQGSVVVFELGDRGNGVARRVGKVVRKLGKDGEEGDDGWIDHASFSLLSAQIMLNDNLMQSQSIYPLPPSLAGDTPAYLDIVPNQDGYDHIALFSPATSSQPRWLTSGNWEVSNRILSVDANRSVV